MSSRVIRMLSVSGLNRSVARQEVLVRSPVRKDGV